MLCMTIAKTKKDAISVQLSVARMNEKLKQTVISCEKSNLKARENIEIWRIFDQNKICLLRDSNFTMIATETT